MGTAFEGFCPAKFLAHHGPPLRKRNLPRTHTHTRPQMGPSPPRHSTSAASTPRPTLLTATGLHLVPTHKHKHRHRPHRHVNRERQSAIFRTAGMFFFQRDVSIERGIAQIERARERDNEKAVAKTKKRASPKGNACKKNGLSECVYRGSKKGLSYQKGGHV